MIATELSEKMEKRRSGIKDVAKTIFRPISRKYDDAEHAYPKELDIFRGRNLQRGGRQMETASKNAHGELGTNFVSILSVEELSWGDLGLMLTIPGAGPGNAALRMLASKEQLEKFGKMWIAMACTETVAGSNSAAIKTTAELIGDKWVLNGEKIFVTAAERCDAAIVCATLNKDAGKTGIKFFIVEKGTPGFTLEKLERKCGIRASDTGTFLLKNCHIPKENLLGNSNTTKKTNGIKDVIKCFNKNRSLTAAMAVGVSKASIEFLKEEIEKSDVTLDYHKTPNNITSQENNYYRMEANLEASRLLAWRASWMADNEKDNTVETSMAKAKAARTATLITQEVCELLGPIGFSCNYLAEKWIRDSKILDIFEGTGQIQHLIVARNVLKLTSNELK